jgi:hypothetical protein
MIKKVYANMRMDKQIFDQIGRDLINLEEIKQRFL